MNERLANVWRLLLDDLAVSTLPLSKWCELHGVTCSQYRRWKRRLKQANADGPADNRWTTVQIIGEPVQCGATVVGRRGVTLRIGCATLQVEPGFDPSLLRAVVQALEGKSC